MNRITRFFLSLLLNLSLCAPVFASNEPSQLVVKLKDNTEKIFILANNHVRHEEDVCQHDRLQC